MSDEIEYNPEAKLHDKPILEVNLINVDKIKKEIDAKFREFVHDNQSEPHIANCIIRWKDDGNTYPVKIQLSTDINLDEDDDIFFYSDSLEDFKSLVEEGVLDFNVIECYSFE